MTRPLRLARHHCLSALALTSFYAFSGCYQGTAREPDPSGSPVGPGELDAPVRSPLGNSHVLRIVDGDGAPIPRAVVAIDDAQRPLTDHTDPPPGDPAGALAPQPPALATPFARTARGVLYMTDGAGRLLLEKLPAGRVVAVIEAPGHAPASLVVDVHEGAHLSRSVTLLPFGEPIGFSADVGALLVRDDVRVEIPPGALVDADGAPVSGLVEATIVPLDPYHQLRATPGPLEAVRGGGDRVDLESFAMAEITLTRDRRPLQLAPGARARVELVLPEEFGDTHAPGDEIPAWWFDLAAGVWREDGVGLVQAASTDPGRLAWVAEVAHFTWWNADNPVTEHSCFSFTVTDGDGVPQPGVEVFAVGLDYNGTSKATTGADGVACLAIKRGGAAEIRVGSLDNPEQTFEVEGSDEAAACNGYGAECIPYNIQLDPDKQAECTNGESKPCLYPAEYQHLLGIGICQAGTDLCIDNQWSGCQGEVLPQQEACDTPQIDEDCSGEGHDNLTPGCECNWFDIFPKSCYDGDPGTLGVGACKAGQMLCDKNTQQWGACDMPPAVLPKDEDCETIDPFDPAHDEDCDGNPGCGHHAWHVDYGDAPRQTAFDVEPALFGVYAAGRFDGSVALGNDAVGPADDSVYLARTDIVGAPMWVTDLGGAWVGELDIDTIGDDVYVFGTLVADVAYDGKSACNTAAPQPIAPGDPGDVALAKFGPDGKCVWVRRFAGAGLQRGTSLAAAGDRLYAAGSFGGRIEFKELQNIEVPIFVPPAPVTEDHAFYVEFDTLGLMQDHEVLAVEWPANAAATPAVSRGTGGVYFAGPFGGNPQLCGAPLSAAGDADIVVARVGGGGCQLLAQVEADAPRALSVAADGFGDVVVTAAVTGPVDLGKGLAGDPGANIALFKLDQAGSFVWSEVLRGTYPLAAEGGQSVAVDLQGRVAVAGTFAETLAIQGKQFVSQGDAQIFALKLDRDGGLQWIYELGSPGTSEQVGAIALNSAGWTLLAGTFIGDVIFPHQSKPLPARTATVDEPADLGDAFFAYLTM